MIASIELSVDSIMFEAVEHIVHRGFGDTSSHAAPQHKSNCEVVLGGVKQIEGRPFDQAVPKHQEDAESKGRGERGQWPALPKHAAPEQKANLEIVIEAALRRARD